MKKSALIIFCVAALEGCVSGGSSVSVSYWTTEVAPPPYVQVSDHPCGRIVSIESSRVPANTAWLRSEVVYEIDQTGTILRSWHTPIDYYPVGVEGDELRLAYGSEPPEVLVVNTSGRISGFINQPNRELEYHPCPKSFRAIDQAACVVHTKSPLRLLAHAPPCT